MTDIAVRHADESTTLAVALEAAIAGAPQLVLLTGDDDNQRSALLGHFAREEAWRRHRIRAFLLRPGDRARYDPVKQGADETRSRAARGIATLRGDAAGPDRVHILMEWVGTLPVLGNLLAAIAATLKALHRRTNADTPHVGSHTDARQIYDAASRAPLVLLLDDVHLVDEQATRDLAKLMENVPTHVKLLVVVSYATQSQINFDKVFKYARGKLTRVHLRAPHDADGTQRVDRTAFDALEGDVRDLVKHAASLGSTFDSVTLARDVQRDELAVEDSLATAVRAGILRITGEVIDAEGELATRYEFTDVLLCDVLRTG